MVSIVIALISPFVRPSVFKNLGNCPLVFSETLHKVGGQKSKECDTAGNLGIKEDEVSKIGGFGHFLQNQS